MNGFWNSIVQTADTVFCTLGLQNNILLIGDPKIAQKVSDLEGIFFFKDSRTYRVSILLPHPDFLRFSSLIIFFF